MERSVTYTYPVPAEALEAERELARLDGVPDMDDERQALIEVMPQVERVRVTVGSASALDYARYNRMRREAAEWFKAKTGVEPHEADDGDAPEDVWLTAQIGVHRAYMLATLRRYEVMRNPWGQDGAWHEEQLPADWRTIEGMAENVPAALFNEWLAASRECNPGLFWADSSEAGK